MRILCLADEEERLVYSSCAKELYKNVDFVISAGDLRFSYYDYVATILNKDLFYVYGNHHVEHFASKMKGSDFFPHADYDGHGYNDTIHVFGGNLVDGSVYYDKKRNLIIAGLGGSMLYNGGPSQYSERQMQMRINQMVPKLLLNKLRYGRYVDILITHAPPLGMGDGLDKCHQGFKCFINFMDTFHPKYLLHGHIHLFDLNSPRERVYKDTKIINVYESFILDDDQLGRKNRK